MELGVPDPDRLGRSLSSLTMSKWAAFVKVKAEKEKELRGQK